MADEDDAEPDAEDVRPEGVPDLTNPRTQREARKRAKSLERERAEVLRALLDQPGGRRLFYWIVQDLCGLHRPTANAAFDPQALHFREGHRAVGLVLHDTALQMAHDQYIVCLAENLR